MGLTVSCIPLEGLDSVPVLTGTKGREGFSRAMPLPEEVRRHRTNGTRVEVPVAEGSAIFQPTMLVHLTYINS